MAELSEQNQALIARETNSTRARWWADRSGIAPELNRLLDAARTEGRGEETRTVEVCPDCDIADCHHIRERRKQAAREVLDMYASPIREPEISREAVIDGLASALHNAVLAITLNLSPDHEAAREGMLALAKFDPERPDAILNLAPVGGRGEGWRPIETAPKIETLSESAKPFIGWCPDPTAPDGGDQRVCWWEPKLRRGTWWSDRDMPENPTHWQPLPPPPQEQGAA